MLITLKKFLDLLPHPSPGVCARRQPGLSEEIYSCSLQVLELVVPFLLLNVTRGRRNVERTFRCLFELAGFFPTENLVLWDRAKVRLRQCGNGTREGYKEWLAHTFLL